MTKEYKVYRITYIAKEIKIIINPVIKGFLEKYLT